jgi:hypothetical protein
VLGMLGWNDIIAGFIQFHKGLHLKLADYSYREIGRRIGRSHIAISREIKRNGPNYPTKGVVCKNAMAPAGVFFQGASLLMSGLPSSISAKGTGGLATHVEHKCRYLLTAKLSDEKASTRT